MRPQGVVVIVGRPNVGKSTLFNRLTRSRRALVHDRPGVTRDRIFGEARRPGGSRVTLIDTGGLLLVDEDQWVPLIRGQAEEALKGADAVLFVVDGHSGIIPEDSDIADYLRNLGVPTVVIVNKADRRDVELQAHEFYALGHGEPISISAEHGTGLAELWEALEPHLEDDDEGWEDEDKPGRHDPDRPIQVAIVGRPNVGKSSLLNRLVGETRVLVSQTPGTTRDVVDVIVEEGGQQFCFLDTAGIRRKGKTERGPEVLSVVVARRHLERADIALLLVDASEGVGRQDAHVAGYAWDTGRSMAIVFNKWDLIEDREERRQELEDDIAQQMKFLRTAPTVYLSALTGRGVHRLLPIVQDLNSSARLRIPTPELNRVLHDAWERRPPAMDGRAAPKLFYATQVKTGPPSFILFTNLHKQPHFSYMRYLENVMRDTFRLAGVPIRVMIKRRKS
ncbi:MAG: ribosome biogenesis GTPase Der [bacterium]|nr:ribosome biogenesis GTPase Der [bacterium]